MNSVFSGRIAPSRIVFALLVLAFVVNAFLPACVDKEKDDIDTSEGGDDTASEEPLICGRSFETDILPFFDDYCLRCHSAVHEGSARNGAHEDMNFDTVDGVKANADGIRAAMFENSGMPPSEPYPSALERDDILAWIDCAEQTGWE